MLRNKITSTQLQGESFSFEIYVNDRLVATTFTDVDRNLMLHALIDNNVVNVFDKLEVRERTITTVLYEYSFTEFKGNINLEDVIE